MAKMFYTLEETAAKLGIGVEKVKEMAAGGRLQQFRDRDKVMFKREQVDAMSRGASADESGGPLPVANSGDTDAIDVADASKGAGRKEDPRSATGVSVFDADEIEPADPRAQTQVTSPIHQDQEQLALESVGSGSGLLDLTRESDDTSLGAELLDEIYPGGGEASDAKQQDSGVPASSGVFDGSIAVESGASGLENLQPGSGTANMAAAGGGYAVIEEAYDPAGSGLAAGFLIGASIALIVGLIIAIGALANVPTGIVASMTSTPSSLFVWNGGLLVLAVIMGVAGFFIGKAMDR
ncbi:MAG: hypothetical protein K8S99_07250 [Planctomycetes bacterium]|nr:hypothetical protein [Planctomycetota bacterium]